MTVNIVIMLNVAFSMIMLGVVRLIVIRLSVIRLNVVRLSVIWLSGVASTWLIGRKARGKSVYKC